MITPGTFDSLALTLERIASTSSRTRKVRELATFFSALDDADLARAVRFLCGQPVAGNPEQKMSIGVSVLREAAVLSTGWDLDMVRLCHREVGDSGEAISLLLHGKTANQPLPLAAAEQLYLRLFTLRKSADKVELLRATWLTLAPLVVKYFIKVITGNFRVGLQEKLVEEAIARSVSAKLSDIRDASNRTGDLAQVALSARAGTVASLEARLFHPLEFMLAKPLDDAPPVLPADGWFVEDKFDGIRSQVHYTSGKVRIFTRGQEDTTAAFPEIVSAFAALPGSAVLDGELLGWRDGRALNFTLLQQRLARKKVTPELQAEIPIAFIGYDLLYRDGALLLDSSLEHRRAQLEDLLSPHAFPLLLSEQQPLATLEDIEPRFTAARARGNEGLLLKRSGTLYESGKRSSHWLKVKRPYGTLDVVVTAAEQGSGRRATLLSDYTFAVRHEDRFLNVGKAYSGLTDDEIRELTRIFRSIATERFGRVTLVQPQVVLEVAFDGVQKSPRHKSGYALRFPRIVAWRKDKTITEADTLDRVRQLYEQSLG